eukprot:341292-Amphidinium_carterae.1
MQTGLQSQFHEAVRVGAAQLIFREQVQREWKLFPFVGCWWISQIRPDAPGGGAQIVSKPTIKGLHQTNPIILNYSEGVEVHICLSSREPETDQKGASVVSYDYVDAEIPFEIVGKTTPTTRVATGLSGKPLA